MHLTGFDLLLWAAGFVANATLLIILFVRRLVTSFPAFATLIGLSVFRTIALFCIQHFGTHHTYFYTYWYLAIVDVALQFGVVCEISAHVFRSRGKWAKYVTSKLLWWFAGSIVVAAALTTIPKASTRIWMQALMIKGSFFSATLMSELFVGMLVLTASWGMPWKSHVARIAEGFAVYSFISVLIETGNTYFGLANDTHAYDNLSRARNALYVLCAIYWTITLSRAVEPPGVMPEQMRQDLRAVNKGAAQNLRKLRTGRKT